MKFIEPLEWGAWKISEVFEVGDAFKIVGGYTDGGSGKWVDSSIGVRDKEHVAELRILIASALLAGNVLMEDQDEMDARLLEERRQRLEAVKQKLVSRAADYRDLALF